MSLLTNPLSSGVKQAYEVAWSPLDARPELGFRYSSQELALTSPAHHTLVHGTRGGGKTETQLMRFASRVGIGYGAYWRGVIFDMEYKNLDDLVAKSKKLFGKLYGDSAQFKASGKDYKWVWDTGEELLFRAVKKIDDYDDYHGHEYPFIGWNELTKYPTGALYDKFMSCNRSSFLPEENTPKDNKGNWLTHDGKPLPEIPLEVFSTTNPSGIGHNWVKLRFIDVQEYPGQLIRTVTRVLDPRTGEEADIETTQVAIFSHWRENRYLSPKYIADLSNEKDPNLRKAWFTGSWDVTAGGAFDDLWEAKTHIIPKFNIPSNWLLDRAFDWGSSEPFACIWFAEANGEEVKYTMPDGSVRTFCPPSGSLIACAEYYGGEVGSNGKFLFNNKGTKLSATKIAEGVRDREIEMMRTKFLPRQPGAGPADNQIRDVKNVEQDTTEKLMQNVGVYWEESDKSKGSRAIGVELFRNMLENTREGNTRPHFYVMGHLYAFIATIPHLPRDPIKVDDVDTTAEDHLWDTCRYRVLKGASRLVTKIKLGYSN